MPYRTAGVPAPQSPIKPFPEPPRGYWPWVLNPQRFDAQPGLCQTGFFVQRDQAPMMAEYLLVDGDLEDARLSLVDDAASRYVITNAPAWLYATPKLPELCWEKTLLQLVWPHGAVVPARVTPFLVSYGSHVTLTWEHVRPQPNGVTAVILCRALSSDEELTIRSGKSR